MKKLVVALLALTCPAQTDWTESITPAGLRGTVSFLASGSLQGRNTPSQGLEVAADYIVSEFRRDGVESPPGATDFAQSARFARVSDSRDSQFNISAGRELTRSFDSAKIAVRTFRPASLNNEPVFKWAPNVSVDQPLTGEILILRAPSEPNVLARLEEFHPDAIVELVRKPLHHRKNEMIDAEQLNSSEPVSIAVPDGDLQAVFDRLPNGPTSAHATLRIGAPSIEAFQVRNLIGLLPAQIRCSANSTSSYRRITTISA